jgi:hypothetical protein
MFDDFANRICSIEVQIKDSRVTARSNSYLDLHLEIDSEDRVRRNITTKKMILILPL